MPKNAENQWTWDHCIQNRELFSMHSTREKASDTTDFLKRRTAPSYIRTVNTDDVEKLLNLVQWWIVAHSILLTMIYEHTSQITVQKWLATYVKSWILRFELQKDVFLPNMFFMSSFDWNKFRATLPSSFARIEERFLSLLYQGVWLVGRPSDWTCCAIGSINSTQLP